MVSSAVIKFGSGKVAVWGEAAMFSAQIAGEKKVKVGMNAPKAKYNYQLLLNIFIGWIILLNDSLTCYLIRKLVMLLLKILIWLRVGVRVRNR